MKQYSDPRHNSRILLIESFFENEFKDLSPNKVNFPVTDLQEIGEIGPYDEKLYNEIRLGLADHIEEIDKHIKMFARERPLDQIQRTDLIILRLAIYEGYLAKITPPKVAIDEAIELAKIFSSAGSSSFVNGVLDNIFNLHEKKSAVNN